MEFAENYAIEQRFSCIRLDAYTGNPRAIALYEGRGYERIGQTYFPRRKLPFDCFEKTLERFIIRRASDTDAEAIADAHRDSILTIGSHFYPNDVVEAWGDAIRPSMYVHAMETGEIFFIAVEGSVVLGFSSHHVVDGQHRTAVYVRGSHARQGVGRALYRMAEDAARRAGATSVHVDASLAAVEFYKRNGLDEVARGEHRLAAGQPMACVFMRKTLTA
jgi:ribosomal protein S18 acetylase RimI-like enzyme